MSSTELGRPEPLGAQVRDGGTNFAIWAPEAEHVELCLIAADGTHQNFDLAGFTRGVFHGFVSQVGHGQEYGFRVHGPWDPESGLRFNAAKLLVDPYAKAITGDLHLDPAIFGHLSTDDLERNDLDSSGFVPHAVVVDNGYDWEGDHPPNTDLANTIIYEAHVRGLTMQHPDVPDEIRGTYAGLAHPAIIAHLRELGVTAIELLPVQHFVSETFQLARGSANYWGYNTLAFFAPHAAYCSSGTRGNQVREFKDMVKALHRAGIEVILDVVYNHTPEGNHLGPTLSFRGLDNKTYYHLDTDNQHYWDSTGCGNTLRVSHPQVLRLVMDSLRYWVQEMHVDGFRFDLATALLRDGFHGVNMEGGFIAACSQDPVLRSVKLIAEPWDVGPDGYQVGNFPEPWSEWNDQFRDTVRDFWRGLSGGVAELGWRLTGSGDMYWDSVSGTHGSINFVTAHDGFTLHDVVSYNDKHNDANGEENRDGTDSNRSWNCGVEGTTDNQEILALRRRQMRNLLATTVLSAGIPMLLAGDEVGRTQQGNNNAYCQDSELSWVNWDLHDWQRGLYDFTKLLIAVRQDHKVFQRSGYLKGENVAHVNVPDIAWLRADAEAFTAEDWDSPETRAIGMYLAGAVTTLAKHSMVDNGFYFFLNSADEEIAVTLPAEEFGRQYHRVFDTALENDWSSPEPISAGTQVVLAPFSSALWIVTLRE